MNKDLVSLVRSWRYWNAAAPDSIDFHRKHFQLMGMIISALEKLDTSCLKELTQASRTLSRGKPHASLLWAFEWAYYKLKTNGRNPTWRDVRERASGEFGFKLPPQRTLRRIRNELELKLGIHLSNARRGRAKKRGQQK
jgi:hypothetical protein